MNSNQVNMWLSMNADKFNQQDYAFIRSTMEAMPDEQMMLLHSIELKKPSTIFLIALFLGWERFMLDNIGLGILKIVTAYGCGIWWLVDVITAKDRARKYNLQQFQKATFAYGGNNNNMVSAPAIPVAPDTPVTSANAGANQTMAYQAPNNTTASVSSQQYYTPENQMKSGESLMQNLFNRVKYLLSTPQVEYQVIDVEEEKNTHTKVLTNYVLLLAIIPFLFALIGGLITGSGGFSYMLGYAIGMGFRLAFYQIFLMAGGIYITAVIINSMAKKFGASTSFDRAFALVAYAYTPMFLAGFFHIWNGFSWLVYPVGIYGLYLLMAGLRPMMKPADEKADNYSMATFLVAVVVFAILWKVLALIFLNTGFSSVPGNVNDILKLYNF